MTIQHTAIPSSLCHEPKQIIDAGTSDSGKVITPSSSVAGQGTLRFLSYDDISGTLSRSDLSDGDWTGWGLYADSVYHVTNKQSITSGTRTRIEIDGLASSTDTDSLPEAGIDLWDTANNIITPVSQNDCLLVTFSCSVESSGAGVADRYFEFEIDAEGTTGVIVSSSQFLTGASAHVHSITVSVPAVLDLVNNGGKIYITPSANMDFWNYEVLVSRVHPGAV